MEIKQLTAGIDALYTKRLWGFDWLEHIEKLEFEESALKGYLDAWLASMTWLEGRIKANAEKFKAVSN